MKHWGQHQEAPERSSYGSPPTVADVARAAGVGASTVSRALNDRGEVKASTRERVRRIAAELGYVSQPAIASLVSRRKTRKVVPQQDSGLLPVAILTRQHPTTNAERFVRLFNRFGNLRGYRYVHFNTLDGQLKNAAQLGRILFAQGFVGVVLVHIIHEPEWLSDFPWSRFALASLDPAFDLVPVPIVRAAHFEDVWKCWHYLRNRGFERIGAILPEADKQRIEDIRRLGALYQCQSEIPVAQRLPALTFSFNEGVPTERIVEWLHLERPDALLAWNSTFLEAVRDQLGYLPESVTILHADGRFSGMEQGNRIYVEIVRLIDQLVRSGSYGLPAQSIDHVVPSQWREAGHGEK